MVVTQQLPESELHLKRSGRPPGFRGGFKTVVLNVFGWGALISSGLVVGTIAIVAIDLEGILALPSGVLLTWLGLLLLDHRRWLNSQSSWCSDAMNAGIGKSIIDELRSLGIDATYEEETFEDDDNGFTQRCIRCRQADAETVRSIMDRHLGRSL